MTTDCSRCFQPAENPLTWILRQAANVHLCVDCVKLMGDDFETFSFSGWKRDGNDLFSPPPFPFTQ